MEPDHELHGHSGTSFDISIAVCTHNGARRLPALLECFARLHRDPPSCEFLVIDNHSTDQTAQAVSDASERMGILVRLVREDTLGKAYAIRRAAREARGNIVCLLDDDNLPAPGFAHWAVHFFDRHPAAGIIGGKILPKWHGEPTPLVQQIAAVALGMCDRGDEAFVYSGIAEGPVGAGLCIRRDLLRRIYDDVPAVLTIGRVGRALDAGDDTALNVCAHKLGFERWYVPEVSIQHIVDSSRMEMGYLLKLFDGIGVGQADIRILYDDRVNNRVIALLAGLKDALRWLNGAVLGPLIMETRVGFQRRRLDQRLVRARARRMLRHALFGWPGAAGAPSNHASGTGNVPAERQQP